MTKQEYDREKYIKHGEKIRKRVREYQIRTGYMKRYWETKEERNTYERVMYALRKQRASA